MQLFEKCFNFSFNDLASFLQWRIVNSLSLLTFIRYNVTNKILTFIRYNVTNKTHLKLNEFNFTHSKVKSLETKFLKRASYDIIQVKHKL